MRIAGMTYRSWIYLLSLVVFLGCAEGSSEDQSDAKEEMAGEQAENTEEEASAAVQNAEENSKKESKLVVKKWKSKAKQQLQSMEDLLLILQDTTLDPAFRIEIEKELSLLYSNQDSVLYELMSKDINFKNFKALELENGDTLSLSFKNKKDGLKAKFVVVSEAKDFGGTTEVIEQLRIISIQSE